MMGNEVPQTENLFNYNDADFDEKFMWVINKWKICPDNSVFSKEIQTPTNIFRFSMYKELSSNFKITSFIQDCNFSFPLHITFIIYNHLSTDLNIQSPYSFIFTPFCSSITFEFNIKQKDLIINNGYVDENDSLSIEIILKHRASHIHPKIQPEVPQMIGLSANHSTFHLNNFLISLFFIPSFRSIVFQTNIKSDIPSLHFQQLYSLLQIHPNNLYELSTNDLIKSLNFSNYDYCNPNFIEFGVKFFKTIAPISYSLFQGSRILIQKCKHCDYLIKKVELFFGFDISINGFENLQDALNSYCEQSNKEVEIEAGEYGIQEADQFYSYNQFPSILFINLNRFYPDYSQNDNDSEINFIKDNSYFAFNQTIDLQPFLENNLDQRSSDPKHLFYFLVGVMVHSGPSFTDGHFYCYIRPSTSSDVGEWYKFDDSKVFFANSKQVFEDNFGNNEQSAYFLVYAREKLHENIIEKLPENIRIYPSIFQSELDKNLRKSVENKSLYKLNLITPNHVEINASHGKFSFEDSNLNLFITPKSTLKDLYEKVSEITHVEENLISLWTIENKNLIRSKIFPAEDVIIDTIIEAGFNDIFVQFLGQETDGDTIFFVFTYFQHMTPAIKLMYTIAQSSENTPNDLFNEYCDITHCDTSYNFTISYRVNDYELRKIEEENYTMKIKDLPDISSMIVVQPDNLSSTYVLIRPNNSQIYNETKYSNKVNYLDKSKMLFPNTIDEFLEITKNMKTTMVIKPPPTSKIDTTTDMTLLLCFPLTITFNDFKFFVSSSFAQNGIIKPNQNFLFFSELGIKPLNFDDQNDSISMGEVLQTTSFEKVYFYNFPFVHFSCMLDTSRLIFVRPNDHGIITHFFRDDTPIFNIIEFAYQKNWVDSSEPFTLVYRRKKNGLLKSQVNPFLTARDVKNPLHFYTLCNDDFPFDFKDIFIPVELIKVDEKSSKNLIQLNFMLKVIPEENFEDTRKRIQTIYHELPKNCEFKLYSKEDNEVELEPESVLSYEKDVILRIYTV